VIEVLLGEIRWKRKGREAGMTMTLVERVASVTLDVREILVPSAGNSQ
jgi:hypothetical protein